MFTRLLTAALLGSLLSLGATVPAHADTPRCASKREYYRVDDGMRMKRVHRIFDVKGVQQSRDGDYQTRSYRNCTGRRQTLTVSYKLRRGAWRAYSKGATWG